MTTLCGIAAGLGIGLLVLRFGRIADLLFPLSLHGTVPAVLALIVPALAALGWWWGRFRLPRLARERLVVRLFQNRRATIGAGAVLILALSGVLAPVITVIDPAAQPDLLGAATLPPSLAHPFGTDFFSRDVFSRVLYGARVSLGVALFAIGLSVTIGTAVGMTAGLAGGVVDTVTMRIVDAGLAFPRLLLLLVLVALWGGLNMLALGALLGLTGWFGVSRVVRAEVLGLRGREFVVAAAALGVGRVRLVFRHLLPNLAGPLAVVAALGVGNFVLVEAGLSYLGQGARPPMPAWGNIIADGQSLMYDAPWIATFPGLAILVTVLGFSLLGDGLQQVMDPRTT